MSQHPCQHLLLFCLFSLSRPSVYERVSQVAPVVKNLPANAGDTRDAGSIPGLGRSPGGGNLVDSPPDPGGLQSMGSQRVGHD